MTNARIDKICTAAAVAACGSQPSGKGGSGVVMFYCEPIAGFVLTYR